MSINNFSKTIGTSLLLMSLVGSSVFANTADYDIIGANENSNYTINEYLTYIEYESNASRPISNIIKAGQSHIEIVETLYKAYNIPLPNMNSKTHITLPDSINNILEEEIKIKIANIAMYESFLKEDLPTNLSLAFETLKRDSEFHLTTF